MRLPTNLIDVAGYLLILSGVLHLIAFALGGFSYGVQGLLPVGTLFIVLGYLLQRTEWRWLGHIAYLGVGIGVSFVIREFFISTATPSWWYMIILVIDALAVFALFWFLWRNPADKKAVAS